MIILVFLSLVGLIALACASGLAYRAICQLRVSQTLAIHTLHGITESRFVQIGGIQQWIQIRGEDRDNPILLILHGGPGMPYTPFTPTFRAWEQHFTVVQWDQRGAGKTQSRSGKVGSATLTIERMALDGIEVAEFLLNYLDQSKLILVAHSWGTILGLSMLKRRPDLFSAYVGTGQIVHLAESEKLSYDLALEQAHRQQHAKALKVLQAIGRPPYQDATTWLRKQRVLLSLTPKPAAGGDVPNLDIISALLCSPSYTFKDAFAFFSSFMSAPAKLFQQIMSHDARSLGTTLAMPVFFFQGDADLQTPARPVEDYFATIQAPHKELLLLPGEGHIAVLTNPDLFLQELIARVRPLAGSKASEHPVSAEPTNALQLPL